LIGACETAGVAFIPTEVCKRRARCGHGEYLGQVPRRRG
jgi:hypothetical protein